MKTLYLHIGMPKTGTTSIQTFCELNRELLKEMGYWYPESIHKYKNVSIRRNGHFLVGQCKDSEGKRNKKKENTLFKKGLQMIVDGFNTYDSIILSDENLWHGSIKHRKNLWTLLKEHSANHNYKIKVIIYLRRQDDLILSWLNQKIKCGWSCGGVLTWESYLENPDTIVMDYAKYLDIIAGELGKESLCVRIFERGKFKGEDGTLISDFLDAVGLPFDADYTMEEGFSNTALTYNGQEIKRIVNTLPDSDDSTYLYVRDMALQSVGTSVTEEHYDYLSLEERKEFLSRYEEGNAHVAKEYLGIEDGKMFKEVTSSKEKWNAQNPYMQEDIIRFFGQIVLNQEKRIQALEKQQKQLLKELDALKEQTTAKELNITNELNTIKELITATQAKVDSSITQKLKKTFNKTQINQ